MSNAQEAFARIPAEDQVDQLLMVASLMISMKAESSHLDTWKPAVEEWLDNYEVYLEGQEAK